MDIVVIITAFLLGWLGTLLVEKAAGRLGLVHAPNERSSHTKPTARGGGLAIAVAIVSSLCLLAPAGDFQLWAVTVLTAVIAAVGFTDDLRDISPFVRLILQALAMAGLIWGYWPLPDIYVATGVAVTGAFLAMLLLLAGLWWLNLFNFMDGIDGIAGSQAVLLLLGSCGLWLLGDPSAFQSPLFVASLAAAFATMGFLIRNWPPARIFMGDAGSNALALFIFAVVVATISTSAISYQSWLILPAVFASDASVTLVRRLLQGKLPWRAHRQHVYQILSRIWGHRPITLFYSMLTIIWAFPLALAAQMWPWLSWLLVVAAYLLLIVCAILVKPDNS